MPPLPSHLRAAIGVVMASRVLSSGAKLVWQKHLYLDEPGKGCRMSAENLGILLGLGPDQIDVHRRTLQRAGLLDRGETRGKGATWSVRFPGELLPRATSVQDYGRAGQELDRYLGERGFALSDSPDSRPGKGANTPDRSTGKTRDTPVSSTANPGAESPASVRGEPTEGSSVRGSGCNPTSSVSLGTQHDGGADRSIGTDGGEDPGWEARRRKWREGLRAMSPRASA